jgi:hypothetical protein
MPRGPYAAPIAAARIGTRAPPDAGNDMHGSRYRRRGGLAVALMVGLLLPGAAAAQSPAPPSVPPTPAPTDDSGIVWPPMGFEGTPAGQPFAFTSGCGVWGEDPIALHGEGGGWTIDLVTTFDTYDPEAFQWFGRVTGSSTAPNGVTNPIDEPALVYYDMGGGRWVLVASFAAQIPAHGCADPSVPPSAGPGG